MSVTQTSIDLNLQQTVQYFLNHHSYEVTLLTSSLKMLGVNMVNSQSSNILNDKDSEEGTALFEAYQKYRKNINATKPDEGHPRAFNKMRSVMGSTLYNTDSWEEDFSSIPGSHYIRNLLQRTFHPFFATLPKGSVTKVPRTDFARLVGHAAHVNSYRSRLYDPTVPQLKSVCAFKADFEQHLKELYEPAIKEFRRGWASWDNVDYIGDYEDTDPEAQDIDVDVDALMAQRRLQVSNMQVLQHKALRSIYLNLLQPHVGTIEIEKEKTEVTGDQAKEGADSKVWALVPSVSDALDTLHAVRHIVHRGCSFL